LPRLNLPRMQSYVLNNLSLTLGGSEQLGRAAALIRRSIEIDEKEGDQSNVSVSLCNLSNVLHISGALHESEVASRRALFITRHLQNQFQESISLNWLGVTLAALGKKVDSSKASYLSLVLAHKLANQWLVYDTYYYQAMRALWFGEYTDAQTLANKAMTFCQEQRFERGMTRAARLQGEADLGLGELATADERLHYALARARTVNLVEEELPAMIGLAELRRRQGDLKTARDLLEDVWELAERGPFKLFHADAYNILAQIERDSGDYEAAVKAATEAYRLAWCDGPPFAYHWGFRKRSRI